MIGLFPISQHALHGRGLTLAGHRFAASLFPFFDDQGVVRCHMITTSTDGRILMVEHRPDLWRLRWRATARELHWAELPDARSVDLDRFEGLWHFDPWWELGEARYSGHPAVPAIKATNVPGYAPAIDSVWFSRDLGRVVLQRRTDEGDQPVVRRVRPRDLAQLRAIRDRRTGAERSSRRPPRERSSWQLRPFWRV